MKVLFGGTVLSLRRHATMYSSISKNIWVLNSACYSETLTCLGFMDKLMLSEDKKMNNPLHIEKHLGP